MKLSNQVRVASCLTVALARGFRLINDKFIELWQTLDGQAKQIVRLKLAHPTASMADLARLMEPPIARQTIEYHLKNKPQIQECLTIIEMDAIRALKSLYPLAILTLRKSMHSKNEVVALDASKFILKKVSDSDHMLPDTIGDSELEFIYTDLGGEDAKEKTEQEKGSEKTDAEKI
jgi:hypothetical protein